jgi:hypothetical protein
MEQSCSFTIVSNEICVNKGYLGWKFQISINHDQLEQAWDLIVPLIVKHKVPGGKILKKEYLDTKDYDPQKYISMQTCKRQQVFQL